MSNVSAANQHTPDDREQKCWDLYVQSIANGTANGLQSALDAGYSEDHARNITMQGWFKERLEKLRYKGMASKAERNLDRMLDTDWEASGEIKADVMRIVADVSKTVAKSLVKEVWSERQEVTQADGKDFPVPILYAVQSNNSNAEGNGDEAKD